MPEIVYDLPLEPAWLWIRYTTENASIFKPATRAAKLETIPRPSKHAQIGIKNCEKTISVKSCFLQNHLYENLVLRTPGVQIPTQKSARNLTWKQAWKEIEIEATVAKKLAK